jgi:hypothetical protein
MLRTYKAKYYDLLSRLGVQGHDGAISEINALRSAANLDTAPDDNPILTVEAEPSPACESRIVGLEAAIDRECGRDMHKVGQYRATGTYLVLSRDCKPLFG